MSLICAVVKVVEGLKGAGCCGDQDIVQAEPAWYQELGQELALWSCNQLSKEGLWHVHTYCNSCGKEAVIEARLAQAKIYMPKSYSVAICRVPIERNIFHVLSQWQCTSL